MSEPDDIDALAAEYVLGTLDGRERADVAARRTRDPALNRAIHAWEQRLAPLNAAVEEVKPPPDMLARIDALLPREAHPSPADVVVMMQTRIRRWRNLAAAASALAACLVVVIGLRETVRAPKPQSYVAVFNNGDVLPAFAMTIDLATRQVTVRPVGAPAQPGRTYQLWIASDQLGPRPQSLGLLGDGSAPGKAVLTSFDPSLLQRATFGVSLEPAGGSPTGQPTSPALHARLLPATN